MAIPEEILMFYEEGRELGRLDRNFGPLERERTRELLMRFFPPPPATIYDIGAGPGEHSLWLAQRGHVVHAVDVSPMHVEHLKRLPLASARGADATDMCFAPDASADAVLMHGPLYHLVERDDRLRA